MVVNIVISDSMIDRWQYGMNILARILGVSAAVIVKNDHSEIEVLASSRFKENPYDRGERLPIAERRYFVDAVKTKKKINIPNALQDPIWRESPDVDRGMISCLVFPLLLPNGEVFGAVGVLDSKENAYSDMAVRLLELKKRLIEWDLEMLVATQRLLEEKEELLAESDRSRLALLSILEDANITQQRLRHLLQERETLLREVHHRVKNNLQIIISLLNLQERSLKNPNITEAFQVAQQRIRAIAAIHEKLYQAANIARIDFGVYANGLIRQLSAGYVLPGMSIDIKTQIESLFVPIDVALPLGLLVNELVTNALKHAFTEKQTGSISVTLWHEAQQVHLIVEDDGTGLPEDINEQEGGNLGMTLVRILTRQLNGRLSIDRKNGTAVRVEVPVGWECES